MYLKKKRKEKKKPQQSCLFQTKRLFFFLLAKSFGRQAKELLISCLTSGEAHVRQQAQQGPLAHGKALSGPYLISWQGLALHPQQCEKKKAREKAGEGRKVCVTGREETKGDPRARLYCGTWLDYTWAYCAACCCWKSQQRFLLLSMGEEWLLIYFHVRQNNAHTGGTMLPFRHSWERGLPKK